MVASILSVPMVAYTYDLPGSDFEPGTPIAAAAVNAKFQALLDASNDLDGAVADLEVTVADLESGGGSTPKTLTAWPDRAMRWTQGQSSSDAVQCWTSINGRPGCSISGMTGPTHVIIPIDAVPDGTLTDWGMHIGTSNGAGTSTGWTCDLRFNEDVLDTLSFDSNAPGQWSRFVDRTDLSLTVDNYADGPGLGGGFNAGWDIHCASDGSDGRLDLHQVFVRYQEGSR